MRPASIARIPAAAINGAVGASGSPTTILAIDRPWASSSLARLISTTTWNGSISSMREARCGASAGESLSGKFNAHAFRCAKRATARFAGWILCRAAGAQQRADSKILLDRLPCRSFTIPQSYGNEYMKIAIIGSGGVGGYFGARLAASGQDVTFV